jgi:hypothetical protein
MSARGRLSRRRRSIVPMTVLLVILQQLELSAGMFKAGAIKRKARLEGRAIASISYEYLLSE